MLKLIEKHFAITLFSFAILGFYLPELFQPIKAYPHVFLMSNLFLGFLRVDLGQVVELKQSFLSIVWKAVISVIVIPMFVYLVSFNFSIEIRIGLFLLASACGLSLIHI